MSDILKNPEGYRDVGEFAYKLRNLEDYKRRVFPDTFEDWLSKQPEDMKAENQDKWTLRHLHTLDYYIPQSGKAHKSEDIRYQWDWPESTVFGGFEGFFSEGVRILDLGSGHGKVVKEIKKRFKDKGIEITGVDYRYHRDRPEESNGGLVGGEFKRLPFKNDTFDRFLSVESFPAWMPRNKELVKKYFEEITRVSKDGAIWRGTFPVYDEYDNEPVSGKELIDYFCQNGWEVVNERGYSFIAKLKKDKKS